MSGSSNKVAFLVATLMFAASVGAIVARPDQTISAAASPAISLQGAIPKRFGDWREAPQGYVQLVNPQVQELLDTLYSEVLTRTYVHESGYRVMLSVAYGSNQRGALQAHKPELCYPAQGFLLMKSDDGLLATPSGGIPVRRLLAAKGPRSEPLTYWFTVGNKAVTGQLQKRIVDLTFALTGRIPDGLLFRVSSIDLDESRAYRMQDQFVNQLLEATPPAERTRLSGLGGA